MPVQQDREIRDRIAVDVAQDLGVGSDGQIAQLARRSREAGETDEGERLITGRAGGRVRVQQMQVDQIAGSGGEVGDRIAPGDVGLGIRKRRIDEEVDAAATGQGIGPAPAGQRIVAGQPDDRVGA